MNGGASGYATEIDYTFGYYRELCPVFLRFAASQHRLNPPRRRPFRYLELGFGQGVSLNIHAAATPGEYWGVDINPNHVAFARELAEAAGSDAHISDLSFAELAGRDDLPDFDMITLHGVWSWVSAENRAAITDIARRKLAPGGLFYVSYNSLPGWAPTVPLRNLLIESRGPSQPSSWDAARGTDRGRAQNSAADRRSGSWIFPGLSGDEGKAGGLRQIQSRIYRA